MNAVDTYINQFTGEAKKRLLAMRTLTTTEVPEAQEGIMYGLVGYKLNKKPLVYFGSFTNHTGFYATPEAQEHFAKELSSYKQGKGSIQFPLNEPLPLELIRRMVRFKRKVVEKT